MSDRRIWLDQPRSFQDRSARHIDVRPGRWFTTLDLHRDGYVDRARFEGRDEDVELHPGFKEALGRCMDAACDYLWVNGYPGGFSLSKGPNYVTLSVPSSLSDEAAEALRAAELDGDWSKLGAIAQKLEIPLGEWLAPGERELRCGIDFNASPSAFLAFLRAKAKRRGLRLNGRAVAGAVWVRPQMSALARTLRTTHPERYRHYADPIAYAEHRVDDDEPRRPYVGGRARPQGRNVTPVTFLETTARSRDGRCACGMSTSPHDDTRHLKAHMQWSAGVEIPKNVEWHGANVAVITETSPLTWRKLAYQCALLPRRENAYDFPSFDVGDGEPSEERRRAYLYQAEGRVVGFASVADTTQQGWSDFSSGDKPQVNVDSPRPAVNVIFVADIWRRRGIARALVEAVAQDATVPVTSVAWLTPFSDSGLSLAKSIHPAGAWLV